MKVKFRYFLLSFLFGVFASCSKDLEPEPTTHPSTFTVRVDTVRHDPSLGDYPQGPSMFTPDLVMSGLPEDEKILSLGGYYSPEDPDPDESDYKFIIDYSGYEPIQEWDWTQDLIFPTASLDQLIPGKTYYFKGVAKTDKGTYYSNTVTIDTDGLPDYTPSPQDRVLPVVFHVMPRKDGTYPHAYFFDEMLACANRLFGNVWDLPELSGAGIRFVPATHTTDGVPLPSPGIHYLDEYRELDGNMLDEGLRQWLSDDLWDMTEVVNVWVCPFTNDHTPFEVNSFIGGFSYFPYFDKEEMLVGCNTVCSGCFSGIFLNQKIVENGYKGVSLFAHEVGHYLGLPHVFDEDWCDDTPQYDREKYFAEQYIPNINVYLRYPIDALKKPYIALNVMDYDLVIYSGITPQQAERVRYTLDHAYLVPGGKLLPPGLRSSTSSEPLRVY